MQISETLIPKRIFYVWFGGGAPGWLLMTVYNWKKALPNYEIIEINEHSEYFNFEYEYNNCKMFKIFYDNKLYAMAADYARLKVIYDHGGIYLDTDITILKDFTPLLNNKFFIGYADEKCLGFGIFGGIKNYPCLADAINFYKNDYVDTDTFIINDVMTKIWLNNDYEDFVCYEADYFYPYRWNTVFDPECVKDCSYIIHWWNATWNDNTSLELLQDKKYLSSKFPEMYLFKKALKRKTVNLLKKIFKNIKKFFN